MFNRFLTLALCVLPLGLMATSCHPNQPRAEELCTAEKAMQVGIEHGIRGIEPLADITHVCDPSVRAVVGKMYVEGHQKGLELALEDARKRTCGYDQGYKRGMNHGQMGYTMSTGAFDICPQETLADSERGYREGYKEGVKNRPAPQPAAPAVASGAAGGGQAQQCSTALGSDCVITVGIKDACVRSAPLEYRFFNPDRNLVYPSNKTVFQSAGPNAQPTHQVQCKVGERICFGASAGGNGYWGAGLSGKEGCQGCCAACGPGAPTIWRIGC